MLVSRRASMPYGLSVGLHKVLSHAIEASLDHENTIPLSTASSSSGATPDLSKILGEQLSSHEIVDTASDYVSQYGSDSVNRVNIALDNWKRTWDSREAYDTYGECNSAFGHPLNFYLLAKLFIVLHFLRHHVTEGGFSGQEQYKAQLMAYYGAADGRLSNKIKAQVQVIDWLSRLRRRPGVETLPANSLVSQVISTR